MHLECIYDIRLALLFLGNLRHHLLNTAVRRKCQKGMSRATFDGRCCDSRFHVDGAVLGVDIEELVKLGLGWGLAWKKYWWQGEHPLARRGTLLGC